MEREWAELAQPDIESLERWRAEVASCEFEVARDRLEQIVHWLQEGNLTLASSLDLYELGVALSRRCHELLEQAQLRVSVLDEMEMPETSLDADDIDDQSL